MKCHWANRKVENIFSLFSCPLGTENKQECGITSALPSPQQTSTHFFSLPFYLLEIWENEVSLPCSTCFHILPFPENLLSRPYWKNGENKPAFTFLSGSEFHKPRHPWHCCTENAHITVGRNVCKVKREKRVPTLFIRVISGGKKIISVDSVRPSENISPTAESFQSSQREHLLPTRIFFHRGKKWLEK